VATAVRQYGWPSSTSSELVAKPGKLLPGKS